MAKTIGVYINADDIKKSNSCSDLEVPNTFLMSNKEKGYVKTERNMR